MRRADVVLRARDVAVVAGLDAANDFTEGLRLVLRVPLVRRAQLLEGGGVAAIYTPALARSTLGLKVARDTAKGRLTMHGLATRAICTPRWDEKTAEEM